MVHLNVVTYDGHTISGVQTLQGHPSTFIKPSVAPSKRYMKLLLEGAKIHGVSPSYLKWLESYPTYTPPNSRTLAPHVFTKLTSGLMYPLRLHMKTHQGRWPRYAHLYMFYVRSFIWGLHEYLDEWKIIASGARASEEMPWLDTTVDISETYNNRSYTHADYLYLKAKM